MARTSEPMATTRCSARLLLRVVVVVVKAISARMVRLAVPAAVVLVQGPSVAQVPPMKAMRAATVPVRQTFLLAAVVVPVEWVVTQLQRPAATEALAFLHPSPVLQSLVAVVVPVQDTMEAQEVRLRLVVVLLQHQRPVQVSMRRPIRAAVEEDRNQTAVVAVQAATAAPASSSSATTPARTTCSSAPA